MRSGSMNTSPTRAFTELAHLSNCFFSLPLLLESFFHLCKGQNSTLENKNYHNLTMSRAIKYAAWFSEVSSGVAAIKYEPSIDPTVLLYLLESFKLNKILSHLSMAVSTSSKHTPPSSPQQSISKSPTVTKVRKELVFSTSTFHRPLGGLEHRERSHRPHHCLEWFLCFFTHKLFILRSLQQKLYEHATILSRSLSIPTLLYLKLRTWGSGINESCYHCTFGFLFNSILPSRAKNGNPLSNQKTVYYDRGCQFEDFGTT